MTPLERAKAKEKNKPCKDCEKAEIVNGALYCSVSGKIILPRFAGVQACRGKRLKGGEG